MIQLTSQQYEIESEKQNSKFFQERMLLNSFIKLLLIVLLRGYTIRN